MRKKNADQKKDLQYEEVIAEESRRPSVYILHVEDDRGDAFLVRKLLYSLRGFEHYYIDRVESIADALEALQAGRKYRLILLDLSVQDAMYLEGLQQLSQLDLGIPIVVLTHTDDKVIQQEAKKMGVNKYLLKHNLTTSQAMLEQILLQ